MWIHLLFYLIGFVIVLALWISSSHNGLVHKRNEAERALSTVEVVLSERHHLLGQLRETLELQSARQETLLLQMARISENAIQHPRMDVEKARLERELTSAAKQLATTIGTAALPVAGQQHLHFQRSIREIEAQLSAAWRAYNAAAMEYNIALETFPSNLLAYAMQLQPAPLYYEPH